MANTNYPKSYILERIAARRASLDSKRKAAQKEIDDSTATIVKGQVRLAYELQKAYEETAVEVAGLYIDPQNIKTNANLLNRLSPGNIKVDDPFDFRWGSREDSPERRAASAVRMAEAQVKELNAELDALDHTEAYLKDTPVEEFSLTSLKRLGLMEAIRFNLDAALAEKKK